MQKVSEVALVAQGFESGVFEDQAVEMAMGTAGCARRHRK
jgi:hypothetical protein